MEPVDTLLDREDVLGSLGGCVDLFDLTGRRVDTLFEGLLQTGTAHPFTIRAADLPSGVYVYRVAGEVFNDSRTVVLIR